MRIELLPNGLIRAYDHKCAWAGLYNSDGSRRSGNFSKGMDEEVRKKIA